MPWSAAIAVGRERQPREGRRPPRAKHRGSHHLGVRLEGRRGEDLPDHEPGRRAVQHLRSRRPRWSTSTSTWATSSRTSGASPAQARWRTCSPSVREGRPRGRVRERREARTSTCGASVRCPTRPREPPGGEAVGKYLRTPARELPVRRGRRIGGLHGPRRWPASTCRTRSASVTMLDVVGVKHLSKALDTLLTIGAAARAVPSRAEPSGQPGRPGPHGRGTGDEDPGRHPDPVEPPRADLV